MDRPKRAGRPPKYGAAMSGKDRAAMHRKKRYESASMAHENLKAASTSTLLNGLAIQLARVCDPDTADIGRNLAAQIMRELCCRNEIPFEPTA